ncbi:cupin domain-containing protein, partial [Deinococcus wulumuqiensis]
TGGAFPTVQELSGIRMRPGYNLCRPPTSAASDFLEEGDSITVSSRIPHTGRNPAAQEAEVRWVTSPFL